MKIEIESRLHYIAIIPLYRVLLKKIVVFKHSKLVRLHCSSCGDIINTSLQPACEIRYNNANS